MTRRCLEVTTSFSRQGDDTSGALNGEERRKIIWGLHNMSRKYKKDPRMQ
jgi:hypothetical protein